MFGFGNIPFTGGSGGLTYMGTWDADLNVPNLTSGVGTQGDYYVVSVAGTTNLDGITDWQVTDWAIFNGVSWQKIDNSDTVVGSGTANQVPFWVTPNQLGSLNTSTYPNLTELSYVKGLSSSVQPQIDAKENLLGYVPEDAINKSTDVNLTANSDILFPSQKAVKTYTDASVTGLLNDRGNWDASTNVFPTTGGSGVGGAIMKGDLWYVSVAGTLGGSPVVVGNNFRALIDNPTLNTDWNILNVGLGYIPENIANKGIANGYAPLNGVAQIPSSFFKYKTTHTHGFNNTTIGSTAGARFTPFGELTMVGSVILNSNPSFPLNARLGVIPKTGVITSAKMTWYITGGNSTQSQILTFRNQTTLTISTITNSLQIPPNFSGIAKTLVVSGLNIPVTENDVVFSVIECPQITVGTPPTGIYFIVNYIIE